MSWKRAVCLGGSLLVLAACSDATAPRPQLKQTGARAAANGKHGQPSVPQTVGEDACRSGYTVSVGRKGNDDCQQ